MINADQARPVSTVRVVGPVRAFALHLREPLFRNAYALMLSTVGTGVVGLGFWALAARRYDAVVVGQNSALIAAMMTVSTFAQLDLAAMLLRFIPRWRRTTRRAVWASYGVSTVAAIIGSIAFVVVASRVDGGLSFLAEGPVAVAFCGAVVVWGIFAIQDGVLTGLGRAPVVPVENTTFGVVKLVLLAAFASVWVRWGIFIAWTVPVVASLVPINLLIFRRYLPVHERRPPHPERIDRATMIRYISFDYVGSLCGALTTMAMPLLVIALLGAEASGHFYVAWTLVLIVDTIALGLGSSLVVEGSFDPARLQRNTRDVIRRGALLVLPATIGVFVLAPLLLMLFGRDYSDASTSTLRVLALGIIPRSLIIVYTSVARVRGEVKQVLGIVLAVTALVVVGAIVLGQAYGLLGIALGWVLGYTVMAIVVLPRVVRAARHPAVPAVVAAR